MPGEFYQATAEALAKLSAENWCASFSGGKDSTSLVTWIEWLRRSGQIACTTPRLVQSDTGVEYAEMQAISHKTMALLTASGWHCEVVTPRINERLYNRILGVGVTPVHAGGARMMRWCTRATKVDPMDRWRDDAGIALSISGVRYGESKMRDGKLKRGGCAAGGECGMPDPDARTFAPIIHWSTCHVIDWLSGGVCREVREAIADLLAPMRELVSIYDVEVDHDVFEWADPVVTAARFGCIGCPAIEATKHAPRSLVKRHGADSPLGELYDVWYEARKSDNRCWSPRCKTQGGPIRMAVRKVLFERVMDIQRRAGVTLVTPEDEAFIRDCWERKVYPRGWSEADEATERPNMLPIIANPPAASG